MLPAKPLYLRLLELENSIDLDRNAEGQLLDANGRAGMGRVAEHLNHQIGSAIRHFGLIGERVVEADEDVQLGATRYAIEIADCRFGPVR